MNILVTVDSNYISPLKVMLKSLFINNIEEEFTIYLFYSRLKDNELDDLKSFVSKHDNKLEAIKIGDNYFNDAPTLMHYTKEMYYRLLAFKFLPQELDKILYLDPDILVINKIIDLYNIDIENYLFAAAYHNKIYIREINRLRLSPYEIDKYYNSGVLVMNLNLQRNIIDEKHIFDFVRKNKSKLIMPDQDILNALYSKSIKSIDEILYNYDARFYNYYKILSSGEIDMDYVINNTIILHFCGKKKPWHKKYSGKFHSLYKHYEKIALA
ncbi:MAG TPA: glycosyltransferase family 8 protein [Defluviitaleaceae bacterium]|nr:glycosyltransferase family 8 protein [Defluviitaleaceae bacterium]